VFQRRLPTIRKKIYQSYTKEVPEIVAGRKRILILVDTKYEFGKADGKKSI
jgi:phosphoribosylaminoimidazole-succinocarboxamide synthase